MPCSFLDLPPPNPFFYAGGPPTPSSLEAAHNLTRERDLMAFMFANNNRFDPMSLALANALQVRPEMHLCRKTKPLQYRSRFHGTKIPLGRMLATDRYVNSQKMNIAG